MSKPPALIEKLRRWLRPPQFPKTHVVEVADAAPLAGALFFSAFKQTIPSVPRHFVLLHAQSALDTQVLGYIHQTVFETACLAGGLVVDAWVFRKLDAAAQHEIRSRGGMAEWLLRESIACVAPRDAAYACIGDAKSLTVNLRIGFQAAGPPFLYIRPSTNKHPDELAALTQRVAALGLF
jgi:hypothetical protein